MARELLINLADINLPAATELLDPITPQNNIKSFLYYKIMLLKTLLLCSFWQVKFLCLVLAPLYTLSQKVKAFY